MALPPCATHVSGLLPVTVTLKVTLLPAPWAWNGGVMMRGGVLTVSVAAALAEPTPLRTITYRRRGPLSEMLFNVISAPVAPEISMPFAATINSGGARP